jgi:hypothetical protein
MSRTSAHALIIKDHLEKLRAGLSGYDHTHRTLNYIVDRLWPELEQAIEEELPENPRR